MLTCPLCQHPLYPQPQGLGCSNHHHFDRARQGYYNLLPVQFKRSQDPGDNAAMVEARQRFLNSGHYQPLADRLTQLATGIAPAISRWLDIGCGEGYYSARLATTLPSAQGYALDISREAVKRGARRSTDITWLVASMARLPVADASQDLLISVFSPIDWQEAARVLKPGGKILRLGPGRDHLLELRQQLYAEVRDYQDDKHILELPETLSAESVERIRISLSLPSPQSRSDLLAMTPHGWRASAANRDRIIKDGLTVTIDGRFDCLVRRPA
ncbi:MAG: methyltransferase domain-containing protein [Gammaproteobacteria bacterium]|nr:methyltransferase domain-containing protein [Gammaproteobacteria bacterium]